MCTYIHTHAFNGPFSGTTQVSRYQKGKSIWILLAICNSAPRSRQITMPAPTTQFFTGWMPFLPPNQQRQSTEGIRTYIQCLLNQLTFLAFTYNEQNLWRKLKDICNCFMSFLSQCQRDHRKSLTGIILLDSLTESLERDINPDMSQID